MFVYDRLTQGEVSVLEEKMFIGEAVNGWRKASTALLGLSSPDIEGSSQNLVGDSTSKSSKIPASTRLRVIEVSNSPPLKLPQFMESAAAFEFLGYTRSTAEELFTNYMARDDPEYNPYGVLEYATGHLYRLSCHVLEYDIQPAAAMEACGINEETRTTLLDPKFADMFGTETMRYWVEDTMKMRFNTLDKLLDRIKLYATIALEEKSDGEADGCNVQANQSWNARTERPS